MGAHLSVNEIITIKNDIIQEDNCVNIMMLLAINNIVKNYSLSINLKWIEFIQEIPIAVNYYVYYREYGDLHISNRYNNFHKGELPIYRHIKIENPSKHDFIYLSDKQIELYKTITTDIQLDPQLGMQ